MSGPSDERLSRKSVLLNNGTVDLNWRKFIAWCDELGWFVAEVLAWIILAGDEGISKPALKKVCQTDISDAIGTLLSKRLVTKTRPYKNAPITYYPNLHKKIFPPGIIITSPIKQSVKQKRLALQSERAKKIAKKLPGKGSTRARTRERTARLKRAKRGLESKKKLKSTSRGTQAENKLQDANGKLNAFRDSLKRPSRKSLRHKNTPSQYPQLNEWRSKKNPNRWSVLDWAGYWLNKWKDCYEQEDPNFVGQRLSRKRIRPSSDGTIMDPYWELGYRMESFRDNNRGFRGDGAGLKAYIDWLLGDFVENADWLKTPIMASQAFRIRNNKLLERFKVRAVKVKGKKGKGKWHAWGYSDDD